MRAGLRKVTKTVKGKKGSVRRSYWVKAKEGAKSIGQKLWRNKGKIALVGAAIGGGLYLQHKKTQRLKNILKDKEDLIKANIDAERHAAKSVSGWLRSRLAGQAPPSFDKWAARTVVNPAVVEQRERSRSANASAEAQRFLARIGKARPLQLGSGETPKPKRTRKKK